MSRLKRFLFISFLICAAAAAPVAAVDFGGSVYNETSLLKEGIDPLGVGQKNVVSIWFNTGTHNPVTFHIGGYYSFLYNYRAEGTVSPPLSYPYLFNLYDFRLTGTFKRPEGTPRIFAFEFGRYTSSDFTGKLFDHTLDGLRFDFTYSFAKVRIDTGFTGLNLKPSSSAFISKLDYNDLRNDSVILGPKRIVGLAEVQFPSLFQRYTLSFAAMFQEDLRYLFQTADTPVDQTLLTEETAAYTPARGGLVDTQYLMLGFNGPILEGFFFNVYGTLNTGRTLSWVDSDGDGTSDIYQYKPVLGMLAGVDLRYYNQNILYSTAQLGFVFTSGDSDSASFLEGNRAGKATTFIPASVVPIGLVFTPQLGNLFYIKGSYSLKPLSFLEAAMGERFQTKLDLFMFFRAADAPISEAGVDPDSESLYLGTEADLTFNYRLFSDVGFSFAAGLFFPSSKTFVTDRHGVWFTGTLSATINW